MHHARRRHADQRLPRPGRPVRRQRDHHDRGGGASAAGGVRAPRRVPMRLLHPGPDLLGGRDAGRVRGRHAQRRDRVARAQRGRDQGADEREPVPLRRLQRDPGRDHGRGREGHAMRPFAYVKPVDVEAAVLAAAEPGAKFLGGGTNLVDLMREGIEQPDTVVDVTGLPFDTVDELPGGGLGSGRWSAPAPWPPTGGCAPATSCCPRRCSPAPPASGATWPPLAATCCSAPAAPTSTTRPRPATSASRAAAATRSRGSTAAARSWASASAASPRTPPTCAWPWPPWT